MANTVVYITWFCKGVADPGMLLCSSEAPHASVFGASAIVEDVSDLLVGSPDVDALAVLASLVECEVVHAAVFDGVVHYLGVGYKVLQADALRAAGPCRLASVFRRSCLVQQGAATVRHNMIHHSW